MLVCTCPYAEFSIKPPLYRSNLMAMCPCAHMLISPHAHVAMCPKANIIRPYAHVSIWPSAKVPTIATFTCRILP